MLKNKFFPIGICLLFFPSLLFGEDRITIRTDGGPKTLRGTVLRCEGREGLVFKAQSGSQEVFGIDRLLDVEPESTETSLAAENDERKGNFDSALLLYHKARENEQRPWVRQYLTARRVRAFNADGRLAEAFQEFYLLARSDPYSVFSDCIPLVWFSPDSFAALGGAASEQAALQWVGAEAENPAASLLAASVLLSSSRRESRNLALERLKSLTFLDATDQGRNAKPTNETILRSQWARLAVAQLWRTKIPMLKNEKEWETWEPLIENLLPSFRAGPYYLLGEACAKTRNDEKAILALMRIPIHFPEERTLTAKALAEAAVLLRKLGRDEEAANLERRTKEPKAEAGQY